MSSDFINIVGGISRMLRKETINNSEMKSVLDRHLIIIKEHSEFISKIVDRLVDQKEEIDELKNKVNILLLMYSENMEK